MNWRVGLARAARRDVATIVAASRRRFGPAVADRYARALARLANRLEAGPGVLGSADRSGFAPGLRSLHLQVALPRGRHVLFYVASDAGDVTILRVLHDAMDPALHLRTGDPPPPP